MVLPRNDNKGGDGRPRLGPFLKKVSDSNKTKTIIALIVFVVIVLLANG